MLSKNQNTLINISIFNDCDSEDVQRIEQQKKLILFSNGEYIIQENQSVEGVYCLLEGAAKIVKRDGNQKEKIVSQIVKLIRN